MRSGCEVGRAGAQRRKEKKSKESSIRKEAKQEKKKKKVKKKKKKKKRKRGRIKQHKANLTVNTPHVERKPKLKCHRWSSSWLRNRQPQEAQAPGGKPTEGAAGRNEPERASGRETKNTENEKRQTSLCI